MVGREQELLATGCILHVQRADERSVFEIKGRQQRRGRVVGLPRAITTGPSWRTRRGGVYLPRLAGAREATPERLVSGHRRRERRPCGVDVQRRIAREEHALCVMMCVDGDFAQERQLWYAQYRRAGIERRIGRRLDDRRHLLREGRDRLVLEKIFR